MNRISFAFRSFFSILFGGTLAPDIAQAFGYSKTAPVKPTAAPKPQSGPADGAVQILSILQRDARLIDFLMEDISGYSDEQVGAAVRDVQEQSRTSLGRYLQARPGHRRSRRNLHQSGRIHQRWICKVDRQRARQRQSSRRYSSPQRLARR